MTQGFDGLGLPAKLLQALARTNNHLTRLISQARIRGGRQEKKQVEELQQALGAQDCRPS